MVEFAKHAFDADSTSDLNAGGIQNSFHDQLYKVIFDELEIYRKKTNKPIQSIPFISYIKDPFEMGVRTRPNVNYKLFEERYAERIRIARQQLEVASKKGGSKKT